MPLPDTALWRGDPARKGKVKRTRFNTGKRPDQKRAVVTLAAGDTIEIFEAKGP